MASIRAKDGTAPPEAVGGRTRAHRSRFYFATNVAQAFSVESRLAAYAPLKRPVFLKRLGDRDTVA